jgi:hypothetical protein
MAGFLNQSWSWHFCIHFFIKTVINLFEWRIIKNILQTYNLQYTPPSTADIMFDFDPMCIELIFQLVFAFTVNVYHTFYDDHLYQTAYGRI